MCKAKNIPVISLLCKYTLHIGICKIVIEGLSRASEIKENLNFYLDLITVGD